MLSVLGCGFTDMSRHRYGSRYGFRCINWSDLFLLVVTASVAGAITADIHMENIERTTYCTPEALAAFLRNRTTPPTRPLVTSFRASAPAP